ncbi:uncharacterized protein B0H18DRAFT_1005551 [Fomitopsis serialis]|uniref:uncharacterized protein n=1 Tax=Fomitopsis serialis TaxID=139415 RepID=UPI00200748C3|nr:uncharacterized protein B0H18DRAFT_1005551 [Neoantrodia serialis]KAH9926785.1 hypothetical protein B0H18DRAFT_1005551 [Neoantrodia serialis]
MVRAAFSYSPATNVTNTQETHAVWTDAPSFDTPSFYTPSVDNPSYTTPFDPRCFDHIMMSLPGTSGVQGIPDTGLPILPQQLGTAQNDAGRQHWMQHGETRPPEPPAGDWPPLPGPSSLDRSVTLYHPRAVPAPAQSGGNLGKLQQAQPNASASSIAPAASLTRTPRNESEAWDGCRAHVDATKGAVKAHLQEAHHADFPAYSRAKDHGAKSCCKWERCTRRPMSNLWRHVFEIHARVATTVRCEKCMTRFTRAESLRRHLHNWG